MSDTYHSHIENNKIWRDPYYPPLRDCAEAYNGYLNLMVDNICGVVIHPKRLEQAMHRAVRSTGIRYVE